MVLHFDDVVNRIAIARVTGQTAANADRRAKPQSAHDGQGKQSRGQARQLIGEIGPRVDAEYTRQHQQSHHQHTGAGETLFEPGVDSVDRGVGAIE